MSDRCEAHARSNVRAHARLAVLACFLALLAPAAGCRARAGGSVITLRFWAMGREGEVVQELMDDFERENPGVRVQVQQMPWSAAHEKLLTAHVGRSTPDVGQLGNTWISEFAALRAIEPLGPYLDTSVSVPPGSYFPGIWDTNVIAGVPYGVPWYVDTRVLFYRRDLLARAGYASVPQTWSEWRKAMVAVKRDSGKDRYAILLPINEWTAPAVFGLQAGSPLLADDGTRGAFGEPAFKRAFAFYLDLFQSGLAPPVTNNEIANVYQEFERGYFAMYITGPWNVGEFRRRLAPGMQAAWATSPLPGPEGPASGVSTAGGSSLVIFRASRHKAEAWRLVEFLSRPEQQVRFSRLTGDLPARREAWQDSSLERDESMRAFREQLERVVSTPKVPEWELVATRLLDAVETVVRGSSTPDSALASLDREVWRLLEKRRWLALRDRQRAALAPGAAR